jgi:hypothetical protein
MKTLRQATIFVKKNDAIRKCVSLGSSECTVLEAEFSVGLSVYPPSKAKSPPDWMKKPYFVDPAEGWRYGFPLLYDPASSGDMISWLIANGYPETLARQGRSCRFIEATSPLEGK